MTGNVVAELWVDGVLVDSGEGTSPVSWEAATAILGESSGTGSKPAATVRFDDASLKEGGVERLDNRGFESAFNSTGTGLSVGTWRPRNQHGVTAGQFSDTVRSGAHAGGINKSSGKGGGFVLQDVEVNDNTTLDISTWVWLDPDTPTGRCEMQLAFDWDRGAGSVSGFAAVYRRANGTIDWIAYDVERLGLPSSLLPLDTWTHWLLRIYPAGKPKGGWHLGITTGTRVGWS